MASPITIFAPVQSPTGTHWWPLGFTAHLGASDPVTLSPNVRFLENDATTKLRSLRSAIAHSLLRGQVPHERRQRVLRACPVVTFADAQERVLLSTSTSRSWELAYVLACLAAAGIGQWEGTGVLWATGEVDLAADAVVALEHVLEAKTRAVLSSTGRVTFLAPFAGEVRAPPGKSVVPIRRLSELFTTPGSPLHDVPYDPRTYDAQGRPAVWDDLGPEPWWSTRLTTTEEVARTLADESKRLVIVAASAGWGKTSLLARSLARAGKPVLVADVQGVISWQGTFEALLRDRRLSEEDRDAIDRRIGSALDVAEKWLDPHTVLVFVGASVNSAGVPSSQVRDAVRGLAERGFRCVVEAWDDLDWSIGRMAPSARAVIPQQEIPALDGDEVRDWADARGFADPRLASVLEHLDGHPLGLAFTFEKLDDARQRGLDVTPDLALEIACEWSALQDLPTYLERVRRLVPEIPEVVRDWFALAWPVPLDVAGSGSEAFLRMLVRLGLATMSGGVCAAGGWLHLHCLDSVRRSPGSLAFPRQHLPSLAPDELRLLRRNLGEIRSVVPAAGTILEELVHLPTGRDDLPDADYVAPADVTVSTAGDLDPMETSWALEQLCRLARWEDVRSCSEMLLADARSTEALARSWATGRSLDAVVRLSLAAGRAEVLDIERIAALIIAASHDELADSFWLARLALRISTLAAARHSRDHARELATAAVRVRDRLEATRGPGGWLSAELDFQLLRLKYFETVDVRARALVLEEILDAIGAGRPDDRLRARRVLWLLRERADASGDSLPIPDGAAKLFLGLPLEPAVTQFLIRALLRRNNVWSGPTVQLAREYARRLAASHTAPTDIRALGEALAEPHSGLAKCVPVLRRAWTDSARLSMHYMSLTGALLQAVASGVVRRTPEISKFIEILDRKNVFSATEGRSSVELRDFWFGWLGHFAKVAEGATSIPASEFARGRRKNAEQDARIAFSVAAARSGVLLPEILALWFRFEVAVRQRHILAARHLRRAVQVSDEYVESVLRRFDEQCPGTFLRHESWARWRRYTWEFEAAITCGEAALREVHSSRQRSEVLSLLLEMIVLSLFTPPELESSVSPKLERTRALDLLKAVAGDLNNLFPENREYGHFLRCTTLDDAYWRSVVEWFSETLGKPSEYWTSLSSVFQAEGDDEAPIGGGELTHTTVLRMVAFTMRWAATRDELPRDLRKQLAVTSATAFLDVLQWERGWGRRGDLRMYFDAATSLAIALQHGSGEELFQTPLAPFESRGGRQLSWPALASSFFQSARDQAIGAFASHVAEVHERFRPLLAQRQNPIEAHRMPR